MNTKKIQEWPTSVNLIEESVYEGDQSLEFDHLVKESEHTYAPIKKQSEPTKDKLIISGWHVPCHCILTQQEDGMTQAFHVQPNKPTYTLLSCDQEKLLKDIGATQNCRAIVIFSKRSWFGLPDRKELEEFVFSNTQEIPVDTDQWWRMLYNPATNEIWVDDKIHKKILKYQGFPQKGKTGITDSGIQRNRKMIKNIVTQKIFD